MCARYCRYNVDADRYGAVLDEPLPDSIADTVPVDKRGYAQTVADELGEDYLDRKILLFDAEQQDTAYADATPSTMQDMVDELYEHGEFLEYPDTVGADVQEAFTGDGFIAAATRLGPLVLTWDVGFDNDGLELYTELDAAGAGGELKAIEELADDVKSLNSSDVQDVNQMQALEQEVDSLNPVQRYFLDFFAEDGAQLGERPASVRIGRVPDDLTDVVPYRTSAHSPLPHHAYTSKIEPQYTRRDNILGTAETVGTYVSNMGNISLRLRPGKIGGTPPHRTSAADHSQHLRRHPRRYKYTHTRHPTAPGAADLQVVTNMGDVSMVIEAPEDDLSYDGFVSADMGDVDILVTDPELTVDAHMRSYKEADITGAPGGDRRKIDVFNDMGDIRIRYVHPEHNESEE